MTRTMPHHAPQPTLTQAQHRELMYGLCIAAPTSAAENRMRTRTAKEQLAAALAAAADERKPPTFPAPDDGEDDASLRANMLT